MYVNTKLDSFFIFLCVCTCPSQNTIFNFLFRKIFRRYVAQLSYRPVGVAQTVVAQLSHRPVVPSLSCPIAQLSHVSVAQLSRRPAVPSSSCPVAQLSRRPVGVAQLASPSRRRPVVRFRQSTPLYFKPTFNIEPVTYTCWEEHFL